MLRTRHGVLRPLRSPGTIFLVILAFLVLPPASREQGHPRSTAFAEEIRESAIAGSWYPSSPAVLREQIDGFLKQVPAPIPSGRLVALISPHAGTAYSGQVAAHAYGQIGPDQKFETVLILAPSHRARFSGVAVHDRGGFRTPLGVVPLDQALIEDLKQRESRIRYVPDAHTLEHSLEIQLPFLQVVMPGFKLVPLLMGEQEFQTCQWLAEAVADAVRGKAVLVVASSDLSHFHDSEKARKLDQVAAERTSAFDPQGLSLDLSSGKCEACGGGPMVTAMLVARKLGADRSQVLQYAHSGDVTGEQSRVVGYMAAALWAKPDAGSGEKPGDGDSASIYLRLTPEEKALLHRIARETIEARCRRKDPPRLAVSSERLKEPRGAFVTLKKHGELRGCIGRIVGDLPLDQTISEMALAAAFHDPRFPSVAEEELKELQVEISVLTPLKRIRGMEEIMVGTHGIYMKRGGKSGLLLPQVATEQGWDCRTFVENTCRKAGLPRDAWKDPDTEIYVFSADVF